ncbi:MAG: SCO family protein [Planctomycetota bacterium]
MRAVPLFLLPLLLLAACEKKQEPLGAKVAQGEGLEVPEFSFLERGGRPYGLKDLKGKVWVASFIFTRCRTTCIPMCGEMMELQDEFEDEPDFRIVATTVSRKTSRSSRTAGSGSSGTPMTRSSTAPTSCWWTARVSSATTSTRPGATR